VATAAVFQTPVRVIEPNQNCCTGDYVT